MTIYILAAFIISLCCGLFFTPAILSFCFKNNLYDIPNERKIHKKAIPRLGGISFFPSMLTAFIVVLMFMPTIDDHTLPISVWSVVFLLGLMIIYGTGIVDDLIGLDAVTKFITQIITASLLPLLGLYINNLYGLFGIYEIPYFIGFPLTVFVIVFIDNAINLIDGIDGLASGLSLIALAGFLVYFLQNDVFINTYCILVAGMIGALLAFSYFNLFGNIERKTKIFMGDSGSLSLGYILGFLAIKSMMDNTAIWSYHPESILVPFTLLFVPSADVVRVTLYRIYHKEPIFKADKNHIHHKLMRMGLTQHQTLVFILAMALGFIGLNYILHGMISSTEIIIIDVLLYTIVNLIINYKIKTAA